MSKRSINRHPATLCAVLLGAASCAAPPGPDTASSRLPLIMDQLHNGGTEGFLFLPPMVPRPAHLGDIVPELPVTVQVDELAAGGKVVRTVARFTTTSGPRQERVRYHVTDTPADPDDVDGDTDPTGFYLARWHTDDANLSLEAIYRARVLVPTRDGKSRELGFADVDLVRNQKQFRAVDQADFTPLINGQTLRIKFRVDRPAVDQDGDGVLDWQDNCPLVANADQADALGNGIGDVCRCSALPADFGGIACQGSAATVDPSRKELTHDFGGGATTSAHLEVSCAATSAKSGAPTTIHSGVLYVQCGETTFVLDPALGSGVQKTTSAFGPAVQTLRFDQKVTRTPETCTGGTCTRMTMAFDIALGDLRAAALPDCLVGWSATATAGPAKVENGRLLEAGRTYPGVHIGALQLWRAQDKTQPILETLDGVTLDGAPSRVRTVCGRAADHGTPATPAMPTLCQRVSESADRVERYTFADLHTSLDTARLTDRASFGALGQLAGGSCPGAGDVRNLAEAYRLPLKLGQGQATLTLTRQGTPVQLAAIGGGLSLQIAAQAPGGAPVALRTLNVDEWPDTGALVVSIPPEIAGASGSTVVMSGVFDRKKKDPPPPPPPKPSPSDHLDLEVDVEVK